MTDSFAALLTNVQEWAQRAHAAGWLAGADVQRVAAVERACPADLFADAPTRPLVAALFGGTGVGKSSLLNRLAGAALATVGVERPTSHEVTAYVHVGVTLAKLPATLPLDALRVLRHEAAEQRDVLWLDMPDIDSTAAENRQRALAWLPHVDVVCYVVSPERYRDDAGWRVLHARGQRHGWVFVLNRWDEGHPTQRDDFRRLLRTAGFADPLLLCTCCVADRPPASPDEFAVLQQTLGGLLAEHGVRELTRVGQHARLRELQAALGAAAKPLGTEAAWHTLQTEASAAWERAVAAITAGVEWPLRATAGRFARTQPTLAALPAALRATLMGTAAQAGGAPSPPSAAPAANRAEPPDVSQADELLAPLWDDWAQGKLRAGLDAIELATRRRGLAAEPVRRRLDGVADDAGELVRGALADTLRAALAQPGSLLQRAARRITGFLMGFLPLIALAWVAFEVVRGYGAAASGKHEFLGAPFAIHSALLVLLAWGLPFLADRLLRPALERVALRALRAGLAAGLTALGARVAAAFAETVAEADALREVQRTLERQVVGRLVPTAGQRAAAVARLVPAAGVPELAEET